MQESARPWTSSDFLRWCHEVQGYTSQQIASAGFRLDGRPYPFLDQILAAVALPDGSPDWVALSALVKALTLAAPPDLALG